MSQKLIRQAYEGRLATWAAARSTPLAVAYENVPFTPTTGTTYLRAFLLPAATDSADLAGSHRAYLGVFQINICAPINTGPGAASGIADELAALFVHNARLASGAITVQQTSPASIAPALPPVDTRFVIPVSFTYRADVI